MLILPCHKPTSTPPSQTTPKPLTQTHAATINYNPHPCLPLLVPPSHEVSDLRKEDFGFEERKEQNKNKSEREEKEDRDK